MTDAVELRALADAVEAGANDLDVKIRTAMATTPGTSRALTSLDAGLALKHALLREGWAWQIDRDSARFYRSMGGKLEGVEGYSDGQPARALLAAVLRARAAEMEGG